MWPSQQKPAASQAVPKAKQSVDKSKEIEKLLAWSQIGASDEVKSIDLVEPQAQRQAQNTVSNDNNMQPLSARNRTAWSKAVEDISPPDLKPAMETL